MKTFICIALLATAAFAAPAEKKSKSDDNRDKRSYLLGGYEAGLPLASSGWGAPLSLSAELPLALPSAKLVSYDKLVSVPKVIEVKKIISEPRIVNEARLVKVSKIIEEPTYTAHLLPTLHALPALPSYHALPSYPALSAHSAGWW